ncbi:hypothetical protein Ancab_039229 [Ancistrocladus abbreviatus]
MEALEQEDDQQRMECREEGNDDVCRDWTHWIDFWKSDRRTEAGEGSLKSKYGGFINERPTFGLPPNSSVEQMPSCCSRPMNIAGQIGRESEYDYNRKDIGSGDKGTMDKRDPKKVDKPHIIPLNNVDSSSLLGVKFSHKGKHVTRPHERNGPSVATGFPPNSSEEQMPSYCSR